MKNEACKNNRRIFQIPEGKLSILFSQGKENLRKHHKSKKEEKHSNFKSGQVKTYLNFFGIILTGVVYNKKITR